MDRLLLAVYIPTWEGAARVFPGHCLVVGMLCAVLFVYARQRYTFSSVVVALGTGLAVGVAAGVLWLWANLEPATGDSHPRLFEAEVIAYIELGRWMIGASLGTLAGWLVLEAIGRRFRRVQQHAESGAAADPAK